MQLEGLMLLLCSFCPLSARSVGVLVSAALEAEPCLQNRSARDGAECFCLLNWCFFVARSYCYGWKGAVQRGRINAARGSAPGFAVCDPKSKMHFGRRLLLGRYFIAPLAAGEKPYSDFQPKYSSLVPLILQHVSGNT